MNTGAKKWQPSANQKWHLTMDVFRVRKCVPAMYYNYLIRVDIHLSRCVCSFAISFWGVIFHFVEDGITKTACRYIVVYSCSIVCNQIIIFEWSHQCIFFNILYAYYQKACSLRFIGWTSAFILKFVRCNLCLMLSNTRFPESWINKGHAAREQASEKRSVAVVWPTWHTHT